ncbi:MAG: tRNA lysidine(34) synthetase TilS [Candidatus Omnitrophica bacterium]|nr:tRNA lysidine(34) synthetase TilS [Candidatus Omnitrophota bacterium]
MIFKKVEKFIEENEIVKDNDRILIAVSGGPDSVFLFHFFIYLLKKKKIEIKVAYIHHHLRKSADKEVEFVKNLANNFRIEFIRGDIKVEERKNLESQLREKRYNKLYEISEKKKCNKIATGHTLDDTIETFFINLLRGSGLSGFCSIWPINKVFQESEIYVIRPILCIEKKEILEYLKKNKIKYMIDKSNLSLNFTRNIIRNKIIPYLLTFRPSLKRQILKTIKILQKEEIFLREYTEKIYKEITEQKDNKIIINSGKFKNLDIAIKRRVAGHIYRKLEKTPYINYQIIEKIVKEIEKGKNLIDIKEKEKPFSFKIKIPGETEFKDLLIYSEFVNFSEKIFRNTDKYTGYFDFSKIKGDIIVRNKKTGDKFKPLGLNIEKRLSRFMIDKKIPESMRNKVLIFENNNKIMWVCGYEISDDFKVGKNTEKIIKISVNSKNF